jgi:glutaredoxin
MKNAKYETIDITNDYEKRLELQKLYGATTVPILVREDGEFVIGYNLPKTMLLL